MVCEEKRALVLKESNEAARARIKPKPKNTWEERIIATIISRIGRNDKTFHPVKLDFSDFANGSRLSGAAYSEITKAVVNLAQTAFVMGYQTRGTICIPIFSFIKLTDEGQVEAELNNKLASHYLELKANFSLRTLPAFCSLESLYSQCLYRFLKSWSGLAGIVVSLKELQTILQVPDSLIKDFAAFRRRVLQVAEKEINDPAKGNFFFSWKPVKHGRKVVSIDFTFPKTPSGKAAPEPASADPLAEAETA